MKINTTPKYAYDDVVIIPQFSQVSSRANVDVSSDYNGIILPVLSANMTTVTGPLMHAKLAKFGGAGVLPRFRPTETILAEFKQAAEMTLEFSEKSIFPWVSVGVGYEGLALAESLINFGAENIVIDVAHGASLHAVATFNSIKSIKPDVNVIVGNFGSAESVLAFLELVEYEPAAIKLGIGPGSACTTREKTGVGYPQLSLILDVREAFEREGLGVKLIADGGIKKAGDVAKALAAGASLVMIGGMFAPTIESPANVVLEKDSLGRTELYKVYSGSASLESYKEQDKAAPWRTSEGETFRVKCEGSVDSILADIEGGLRSAFSYVGAKNLAEFRALSKFGVVTPNGLLEGKAHGKE